MLDQSSSLENEGSITTTDVIGGASAAIFVVGGVAGYILNNFPSLAESANTCGKVATAALVINLVSLAVKQRMGK